MKQKREGEEKWERGEREMREKREKREIDRDRGGRRREKEGGGENSI